jgi:precorrin-8X/cobalt-precorrin-8 methylmutase
MTDPTQSWSHPLMADLPILGADIEARSHAIIGELLGETSTCPIARRIVHATADVSFAESLRIHPEAMLRGAEAIQTGRAIICDVRMVQVGVTRTPCEVLCAISQPEVLAAAKAGGSTRAAAAMEFLADRMDGAIVVIGNAPTALWKVLELAETRGVVPAVVVGLPVGFVGAAESKQALLDSELCYITNVGPRGGSPVAAAAVNALAITARKAKV